jgi:hypothetical protein
VVFVNCQTSLVEEADKEVLGAATQNADQAKGLPNITLHCCKGPDGNNFGLADLIGYRIEG